MGASLENYMGGEINKQLTYLLECWSFPVEARGDVALVPGSLDSAGAGSTISASAALQNKWEEDVSAMEHNQAHNVLSGCFIKRM